MDETRARYLARYRVGVGKYMGIDMDHEEINQRRQFIRTMLRGIKAWQNLSNDQIDNIRIFKNHDDWYIEDQDYYEYVF